MLVCSNTLIISTQKRTHCWQIYRIWISLILKNYRSMYTKKVSQLFLLESDLELFLININIYFFFFRTKKTNFCMEKKDKNWNRLVYCFKIIFLSRDGENTQYRFHEKLLGVEDCPGDELKNGEMERSILLLLRSGGDSKQKKI